MDSFAMPVRTFNLSMVENEKISINQSRRGIGRTKRRGFTFVLLATVLAALIVLPSATPASADVEVCGVPHSAPTSPQTYDFNGIVQFTTQGNQTVINKIRDAFNAGTSWCGPLSFAIDVGADVVAGSGWELVELNVPKKYDVIIAVAKEIWKRLQGQASSQAPAEAPSQLAQDGTGGSGVSAPVDWTGGVGLQIRPSPARTGTTIGIVPDGATLSIGCATRGETVSGPFGPTDLWDYVSYDGQTGYVSDGYVNTGTSDPVAPSC